jgi:hypothetical protein
MRSLVALILVLTTSLAARGDEPLRWKLKKGQTLRYRSTTRLIINTETLGRPRDLFDSTSTQEMTLRVRNADSAGIAEIEQTVDRVVENLVDEGVDKKFDSHLNGDQSVDKQTAARHRARVGVPVLVKMDASGEIREITWPKEALEAYRNATGLEMLMKGSDRDTINISSIVRSLPVSFPERAVADGGSWKFVTKAKHASSPDVELDRITIFRYEGTKDGIARITVEHKAEMTKGKLEPSIMGSGLIRFDTAEGILRDIEMKGSDKVVQMLNGVVVTSTSEMRNKSELIPPDAKTEPPKATTP